MQPAKSFVAPTAVLALLDLLVDHYVSAARTPSRLAGAAARRGAPESAAFEVGNEENLSRSTEGYKGAPLGSYPCRWRFNASDFSSSDRKGVCPQDQTKPADLDHAVSSYVAWLADTYALDHGQVAACDRHHRRPIFLNAGR